jgi:UDP:flavonoid glycosyltransferase YjiC (YdhE family)
VRVLLTTRGSSGHLGPLAPFGHALLRAGHEVHVAAQGQFAANVARAGFELVPLADPPREDWMPLMARFAELDLATAHAVMIRDFFAGIDVRATVPGLTETVERRRPDLIVRETWEFGSALVAERHGIPMARVGLGLAEIEEGSIELAAPAVDDAGRSLGLRPDARGDRLRRAPYLTMMPAALEASGVAMPAPAHRFRFGRADAPMALPDWWPGNGDPLVYMTFGSVAAAGHLPYYPELYRRAIAALAPLPIRLLVTVGDATREVDELGPLPANVHVETWVPHDAAAAAAAAIVCHGGYGSTLGALAHRVPLIVMPLFSGDQWANADAVARAGAGVAVEDDAAARPVLGLPDAGTVDQLPAAVTRVLEDPSLGDGARRVADAMEALPPVDAAVEVLEEIAAGGR